MDMWRLFVLLTIVAASVIWPRTASLPVASGDAVALAALQPVPSRHRADELLVRLHDGADDDAPRRLAASMGATVLDRLPELAVFRMRLPAGTALDGASARLRQDPDVDWVEPNVIFRPARTPSDPLYQNQTSYLATINAPAAWDMQTGDQRVIVAVLDSGIDIGHPDLQANIWTNPKANTGDGNNCGMDLHGCNFVDGRDVDPVCAGAAKDVAPNPNVTPDYWHGTFVAGIVGAQGDNGIGSTGILWHVSLMPVRVGDCTGPNADSVAQGVLYAARNGARVINMSFGEDPDANNVCHNSSRTVEQAVQIAYDRYGVVMVSSSGNGTSPTGYLGCVDYPAAYPQVIAVAATAPGDVRAPFSQYGPEVAVAAPGTGIVSTLPRGQGQSGSNALYDVSDGTSYATPIVAGEAALLISQNHLLTPDMVRSLIQAGAVPVAAGDAPNWAGAGRVDLAASLRLVPAGLYGAINASAPVVDGTAVEARIGTVVCGSGQTFTLDGRTQYTVFVPPLATKPGCGLPGAVVDVFVSGARGGAAVWRPSDIRLDLNLPR